VAPIATDDLLAEADLVWFEMRLMDDARWLGAC
jgi:hypothetical protein